MARNGPLAWQGINVSVSRHYDTEMGNIGNSKKLDQYREVTNREQNCIKDKHTLFIPSTHQ